VKTDDIKAFFDSELDQFIEAAQAEKQARAEKRKQEAITKIREIAASQHISVHFDGQRGRPPKVNGEKAVKNGR